MRKLVFTEKTQQYHHLANCVFQSLTGYTIRPAVTLFSSIFTHEGTIVYMGCDRTEHRGQKLEQRP
jgi:hypothetical protein